MNAKNPESSTPRRLKVNPLTAECIRRVAALLAAGKTLDQAARAVGRTRETVKDWRKKHADLFAAADDVAMTTAATILRAQPQRAAADPKERILQARKLEAWCEVRGQILLPNDGKLTLMGLLEGTYRPRRLLGRSAYTLAEMRSTIRMFGRYLGHVPTIEDLTDDAVSGFMGWTLDIGRAAPTANKHRATLLALWRFARKRKLIDTLPEVEKVPVEKRLPTCWTMEEMGQILRAARTMPGLVGDIPAGDWWTALLMVCYDTGLRIGALLSADRSDLDKAGGWLRIKASKQKQKAEQRFRLHPQTLAAVDEILKPGPGPIFDWPHTRKHLQEHCSRLLTIAGFRPGRLDKFHKIRRTTATYLAAEMGEAVASAYLGHSCLQVTRAYIDPTKLKAIPAIDVLPRPIGLPG